MSARVRSVILIVICQVASMTLWFSASAAVPNLLQSGAISGQQASLLTGAVQLGFVAGTLASALSGLADRFDPRRLFALAATIGALANILLLWSGFAAPSTVALRFVTGFCMAGVYPVGMKLAAAWSQRNIGLMIGTLVGALTLGSALPHLFNVFTPLDWQVTVVLSSVCALAAAAGIGLAELGPNHRTAATFSVTHLLQTLRRRSLKLTNLGYLGHMWELYAMWAWIGSFLAWSLQGPAGPASPARTALMTFIVIASGAVGSLVAGLIADRFGRTSVTIAALLTSGTCAMTIGFLAPAGAAVVLPVAILWGVTVVADSGQFSAAIAELSDPPFIGTALTAQTCLGFLLTFVAIQAMPLAIETLTWRYAFAVLAIGPFLGAIAMWRLRSDPDALQLAHGRK
jgi:MFS family permease